MNWRNKQQMVIVLADDWQATRGYLYYFQYENGYWQKAGGKIPVSLGVKGIAWGLGLQSSSQPGPQKREGDLRSPAGIFKIGHAFGYQKHHDYHIPYEYMTQYDFCIDQTNSPYYNRIINIMTLSGVKPFRMSEPMRRDLYKKGDMRYQYGFIIRQNEENRAGYGSCIFAHLRFGKATRTAGCIALDKADMNRVLSWFDFDKSPLFVLLPVKIYRQKQRGWKLPAVK